VEYKIFGPRGTPYGRFDDQLKMFLKLDLAQQRAIAEAFLQNAFDNFGRPLQQLVAASSILPEQFSEAADLVRYLLYSWREYDLHLSDIEEDLLLLGCHESDIKTIIEFLETLSSVRDGVWSKNYERVQQLDGLPTMDNINILCDARAVFGGFPDAAEQAGRGYKTLLGLKPIIIMEILSSDNYGRRQRTAFQMSEKEFESFRRIITRAQEQLAIMKERIEPFLLRG
jgi:hypothetical protein